MLKLIDIFLLIFFIATICVFHKFSFFKSIKWLNLAALLLMLTFRSTGVDLENYRSFYSGEVADVTFSIEPMWYWIRDSLRSLGVPFFVFVFCSLLPFFYAIVRVHKNNLIKDLNLVLLMFLVLFYFHAVSGIRAFGASAFFILALLNFYNRKYFSFIVSSCFATLAHSSGIMAFAIPIIAKYNFSKTGLFLSLTLACLFGIVIHINSDYLLMLTTERSNVFEESVFKLIYYLSYERTFDSIYNELYLDSIYAVRMAGLVLLSLILINIDSFNNKFEVYVKNVSLVTIVLSLFFYFAGAPVIATRIFDLNCVTLIFLAIYLLEYRTVNGVLFVIFASLYFILELLMNAGLFSTGSPFYLGY